MNTRLPCDRLLDIGEILKGRRAMPSLLCGVYFLFAGDDLIYVGKSTNVESRVHSHTRSGVQFDSYALIECDESELADVETAYILRFKPPRNGRQNYLPELMKLAFPPKTASEWNNHYRSIGREKALTS